MIPIMIAMDEILKGPYSADMLKQARENSEFAFDSTLVIDAMNSQHENCPVRSLCIHTCGGFGT